MTIARVLSRALLAGILGAAAGCGDGSATDPPRPATAATPPATAAAPPAVVTVTPAAADMVRQLAAEQPDGPPLYLRVRVVPGGCQGFMHKLDLEPAVTAEDHTCASAGVRVVLLERQVGMLRGATVDYVDEDGRQGFKVDNPNFKGEAAAKWLAEVEGETDALPGSPRRTPEVAPPPRPAARR